MRFLRFFRSEKTTGEQTVNWGLLDKDQLNKLIFILTIVIKEFILLTIITTFAFAVVTYLWYHEWAALLIRLREIDFERYFYPIWYTDAWWWIEQDIRDVLGIDLWPDKRQFMRYIWEKDFFFLDMPFSQNDPEIFPQIYIEARKRVIKYISLFFGQIFFIRFAYQVFWLWWILRKLGVLPVKR